MKPGKPERRPPVREYQTWGARKPRRRDWRAESGEIVVWIVAAALAAGLLFME